MKEIPHKPFAPNRSPDPTPDKFLTLDERERKQFRRWLARQKKDKETQVQEEITEDFESLIRAKEKWLMTVANVHIWKYEAKRLAVFAREAREKAEREELDLITWTATFHARLQEQITLTAKKVLELVQRHQDLQSRTYETEEQEAEHKKNTEEVVVEIRGAQKRISKLQALRDYKPVRRVLDLKLEDIPVTEIPAEPSDAEHAAHDGMKSYYEQRYCSACGRAKIASFHPLCRACQKKESMGGLRAEAGDWTGVNKNGNSESEIYSPRSVGIDGGQFPKTPPEDSGRSRGDREEVCGDTLEPRDS